MTNKGEIIIEYTKLITPKYVKLVDGTSRKIIGNGSVKLNPNLIQKDVIHAPDLRFNLLSVGKLIKDSIRTVDFSPTASHFQDANSRMRTDNAKYIRGLILLEPDPQGLTVSLRAYSRVSWIKGCKFPSLLNANKCTTSNQIVLWHQGLGHPNFQYLRKLFPHLFTCLDTCLLTCETCN